MRTTQFLIATVAAASVGGCGSLFEGERTASGGSTAQVAKSDAPQRAEVPQLAINDQLIRKVQEQLHAKGIDAGPIDGIWGPQTHEGVREFQKAQALEPTGQLNARTLSALGILGTQTASAGEQHTSYDRLFERADKDNNGSVSREEFESTIGARTTAAYLDAKPPFAKLDANDDGYVSLAEAGADTRVSRDFKEADRNDDGKLDGGEYRSALEK